MTRLIHTFNKPSFSLTMSPDGKWIAQNKSSRINLYDAATYEQVASFNDFPYISKEVFSSDGKYLLAKSTARKLALYDLGKMELIHKHNVKGNSQPQDEGICFSSDNKKIVDLVYDNDMLGYIAVWDIETWTETRYFEGGNHVFDTIVSIPSKEKCFVSGHRRGSDGVYSIPFYLWFDAHKGFGEFVDTECEAVTKFMYAEKRDCVLAYPFMKMKATIAFIQENRVVQLAENDNINHFALSADNTKAAVQFDNRTVVYDFPSMEIAAELDVIPGPGLIPGRYGRLSFSPDGQRVLIGTWGNGFLYALD